MRYLRWYCVSTEGAPLLYIQAWSVQDAREQSRAHHLYKRAVRVTVRVCEWREVERALAAVIR